MTLVDLMDTALAAKKARLTNSPTEGSAPMFVAELPSGTLDVAVLLGDQRSAELHALWLKYRQEKVVRYIVISEAWMVEKDYTKNPDHPVFGLMPEREITKWWMGRDEPMPRDDPNRVEVLMLAGVERGSDKIGKVYKIVRDHRGKPSLLAYAIPGADNPGAKFQFGGRMTRLLDDTPPEEDVMPEAKGNA